MTKIMTASPMTDGQIDKAVDSFRAALRKHRGEISIDDAQSVLGTDNLGMVLYAPFHQLAERACSVIILRVTVNRARSAKAALAATGRLQYYVNDDVVAGVPNGEDEEDEVEVEIFKLNLSSKNDQISDEDLEIEFDRRGLRPADLFEAAGVSEADPTFADKRAYSTHWKNAAGEWCFATFNRWYDGRLLLVASSNGNGWCSGHWFAGVRKKQS